MATFETTTYPLAFAHMEGGVKTVFVAPYSGHYAVITSGDRVEFEDLGTITVGTVRRHTTLEDLLGAEGFDNVVPEAKSLEHACELLRTSAGWDHAAEASVGVVSLRVRGAKRKS